jgi:uncharacterized Ntn-hydrolase superfamily protein
MKKPLKLSFLICLLFLTIIVNSQDTFSIVAVDVETGEVGSAGASCVELNAFGLPPDFLGVLFPDVGAINTQAYYISQNQDNATTRMNAGDTPQEIIDWLVANDVQNNPTLRQYGVVRIISGQGNSAAHTGSNTDDYKGHRTGPGYSIQGNILLGPEILDSMEANFINTQGSLADKLMAALQGANVAGADSRCLGNGTSSLFAFLKVAQPDDAFGAPSLVLGVDFLNNSGTEPIDSLQNLFDEAFPPVSTNEAEELHFKVFPNPSNISFFIESPDFQNGFVKFYDLDGKTIFEQKLDAFKTEIHHSKFNSKGMIIYQIFDQKGMVIQSGKLILN